MKQSEIDREIQVKACEIKSFCMPMVKNSIAVVPHEWREVPSTNVRIRACSLNLQDPDLNVADVIFSPGGRTEPHTQLSDETIFCISGTYVDPINNRTLRAGDVQRIPAGQVHSGRSDDALLTISWKPAFRDMVDDT